MRKPRVYIAGPISSSGSLHENIHNGIRVGEELRRIGYHPFIPHLYDFTKVVTGYDVPWADMLDMDENWISACDALIALPGISRGKEREMAFALSLHLPVIELLGNSIYEDGLIYPPVYKFLTRWKQQYGAIGSSQLTG